MSCKIASSLVPVERVFSQSGLIMGLNHVCMTHVYLAVLYYTTREYQAVIDHCTLVTRLQDHSQCLSRVVQGELLPKIDNNTDNVLGLVVFYRYVCTAALKQQQQQQQQQTYHIGILMAKLFAHYLCIRSLSLSVANCYQFTETRSIIHEIEE